MKTGTGPAPADIEEARRRLEGVARVTPVYGSETFSRLAGRTVHLKAENLQRTGSFKVRGAVNKIATLRDDERRAGVIAASAGNHGQAVAWAGRQAGIPVTVLMPQDAAMAKVDATRNYGATVELVGAMFDEALVAAQERAQSTGAVFIHAFEDEDVIAGQGTIGLELGDQVDELETVVVAVGGGGLASGIGLALREVRPRVKLVGVQAEACAPLAGGLGRRPTIADGIAVKHPGELTTALLRDLADDIVTVTEEEISAALILLLERTKLVVEGAGAVPVAAILNGKIPGSGPVAAVLSGGNIDPTLLIEVMRHGLTLEGRYLVVRSRLPDRPGELLKLLTLVAEEHANLVSVEHHREGMHIPIGETEVELTVVTRDEPHCAALLDAMRSWGYPVERVL